MVQQKKEIIIQKDLVGENSKINEKTKEIRQLFSKAVVSVLCRFLNIMIS